MNCFQSSLKTTKSSIRKSVSTDSLPDLAMAYQSLSMSQASLESIPCIFKSISDSKLNKTFDEEELKMNISVCLASPPDIRCDTEEGDEKPEVRIIHRRRRENTKIYVLE
jgi:hypothetical protein